MTRRPTVDSKGKLVKFLFSEENIKLAFGLNNLYEKAKTMLKDENKVSNGDMKKVN